MRGLLRVTRRPVVIPAVPGLAGNPSYACKPARSWKSDLSEQESVLDSTSGVEVLTGLATFPDITGGETDQSHAPHFKFSLDDTVDCGARVNFILSMMSDQDSSITRFRKPPCYSGTFVDPAEASVWWANAVNHTIEAETDSICKAAFLDQVPREPRKMSLLTRLSELNNSAVGTTPSPSQRAFSSVSRRE